MSVHAQRGGHTMAVDQRLAFPSLMGRAYRGTAAGGTTRWPVSMYWVSRPLSPRFCGAARRRVPQRVPFAITYAIANGVLTGPGLVLVALI
jgi:hypothetical protein